MTMIFRVNAGTMYCGMLYVQDSGEQSFVPASPIGPILIGKGVIPKVAGYRNLNLLRVY